MKRIQATVAQQPEISRRQLSRQVCRWLDWRNAMGEFKEMSCRVALLKLYRRGHIDLPAACERPPRSSRKQKRQEPLEEPPAIDCTLAELGAVELVRIDSGDKEHSGIWNELMARYHYLGAGPLCGAQIRYLIRSDRYGWLGGLAFSAAAWHLKARDRWIGWDKGARRKSLKRVVCNSRFLICPQVRVADLASFVLSLSIRRLRGDWPRRYGIEPVLLETFVQRERFAGTCYRAANWEYIGTTAGRGRQDRKHHFPVAIKDIYLYALCEGFREILCDGLPQPVDRLAQPCDWAEEEFGTAELGDKRRRQRLLTIARDFYARPQANIPQACGSRAKTKAAYRFFEEQSNAMDTILTSHHETTVSRIQEHTVVLAVQDTTTLNYSTHPATGGLGLIASKQGGVIGLVVHDTMGFNVEGTPLGLVDVQCWARDPADFGKKHLRRQLTIEQKESHKWLKSYKAAAEVQKQCPETMVVSVGDREADIYELFQLALSDPDGAKLLVRAEHNRLLADGQGHVWDYVAGLPTSGIQEVQVPRKGRQKARVARLEVRFSQVTLNPPPGKGHLGQLSIWAVLAEEKEAPEGTEPVRWMLLTTCAVETFEQATEKLGWYCHRWGIEIYHKTLKSGCRIEQRQLGHADRIEACLAIDMVVAWRIYHLTKLARETPDAPCTVYFEDAQWKALVAYKTQNPIPPEQPPGLREATRMVASLGGFLGRKCDGEPGTTTIWLGLQRLDDMTAMWKVAMSFFAPQYVNPPP